MLPNTSIITIVPLTEEGSQFQPSLSSVLPFTAALPLNPVKRTVSISGQIKLLARVKITMWLLLLAVISAATLAVFLLFKYINRNKDYWKKRGVFQLDVSKVAPVWKQWLMLVPFNEMDHGIYKLLGEEKYGGYVQLGIPALYVKDLDLLKRIFVKDFEYFAERRNFGVEKTDKLMSKMLSLTNGNEWKELRSAMSPAFTTSKIKAMFQFFNACGHEMASYVKDSGKTEIDFQDVFGRFTLGAIATIAFGYDAGTFKAEDSTFRNMLKKMQTLTPVRFIKMMLHLFVPRVAQTLRLSLFDAEPLKYFTTILERVVKYRRETGEKRQDFLQLMLDVQAGRLKMDEKDLAALDDFEKDALLPQNGTSTTAKKYAVDFDDTVVLAQSFLFFIAGADTLESLLTLSAYELALNPDVQEKLAEEVTNWMEDNGGEITYDGAQSLQYMEMFVSETLRLHPPAFATERKATMDYKIPGTDDVIPKDSVVVISINGIHRDPNNYPEPDKFNPENFSPENKAKRHPYTWSPFGQGPRNCIAMRFALLEAKAAIAHLVYNFKVEPCQKTTIPFKQLRSTTIKKPANGMWLKFIPRNVGQAQSTDAGKP